MSKLIIIKIEKRIERELLSGTVNPLNHLDRAIGHTHSRTHAGQVLNGHADTAILVHPGRVLYRHADAAVFVVVVMIIRRRVIIQTSSLWAMRVESCGHSHPSIQQLHILPHY
ncbi:hypothetical protein CUMW_244170 [Citrus unshiu]|uniref:Uncharacterized protein n=1 Tax=Citrus unshiu TaxID=55188 RepID=A0A2H5QMK6_CITUN|nr:hypothetical protein CUMW_244170 [Citrus unshiu]